MRACTVVRGGRRGKRLENSYMYILLQSVEKKKKRSTTNGTGEYGQDNRTNMCVCVCVSTSPANKLGIIQYIKCAKDWSENRDRWTINNSTVVVITSSTYATQLDDIETGASERADRPQN